MALFVLQTDSVRLTWSGPAVPPDPTAPPPRLDARALRADAQIELRSGSHVLRGTLVGLPLGVAEQGRYRVLVQGRTSADISLRQSDPALVLGLTADHEGNVLHGTIDFRGQVGRVPFELAVGGVPEVAVTLDVVPITITTSDVEALREDVDGMLSGLALEYLGALAPAASSDELPARATWLLLLRDALDELDIALGIVARHPLRDIQSASEMTRVERVRRPDSAVRRALRIGPLAGEPVNPVLGLPVPRTVPAHLSATTLDIPEHRRLRTQLESARRTLAELAQAEVKLPDTPRRRRIRRHLAEAVERLARFTDFEPLRAASAGPVPPPTPRMLVTRGYAEAHAALRRLETGLAVGAGPLSQATKDLPLLYEMWAYLTLLRELAAHLRQPLTPDHFFRGEHVGIRLLLRRGRRHAATFRDASRRIDVLYNPRLGTHAALLAQRPDILLTISAPGTQPRWFVLDAKYRLDATTGYRQRLGVPGPPADALGDLHRYRDAILADSEGQRLIEAAIALYPYRPDDSFEQSRLWRSVQRIGVGAIPVLPGETQWLRRWLTKVLA